MQCLLEASCSCDVTADIYFTNVMAAEGIKVLLTIHVLLYAADLLFSCIIHKVIIPELIYLHCVYLEVGYVQWRA